MSVFWWMKLDFFSLEWYEVSSNEFCDVSAFGLTLVNLYIEAQGYVPALLENLCVVLLWNLLPLGWCLVSV